MTEAEVLRLGEERAKELGLNLIHGHQNTNGKWEYYFMAGDIHRLLGSAINLFGQCHGGHRNSSWTTDSSPAKQEWPLLHTHQALLIGIKPIAVESEERKLLRDLWESDCLPKHFDDRAKALLERKA